MSPKTDQIVYRGVKWRRSPSGGAMWFNEGLGRWVSWHQGADAPPVPEDWAAGLRARATGPSDAMSTRPPLRSPFRLVPIAIFVFIIVIALYQALKPPAKATQADIAAARALRGQCLPRGGGTASSPVYSTVAVPCSSSTAAVRVVAVVSAGASTGSCPRGSEPAVLVKAGVVGEPFECLEKLGSKR